MPRRRTGRERHKRAHGTARVAVSIRFSEDEAALVRGAGALAGPTLTEWARQVLLVAAEERMALEPPH